MPVAAGGATPRGMDEMIEIGRPRLAPPGADDNKYTRGKVVVIGGAMPGAGLLAACAAQRAGAGYVEWLGDVDARAPLSIVQHDWDAKALDDPRVGAIVVGPGLGRDAAARLRLEAALASDRPLVIDADALTLIGRGVGRLAGRRAPTVLTPHAGEYARMCGTMPILKSASLAGAIVVMKGSRTMVASPDGRQARTAAASPWLATAGTGDVLAGVFGALLAQREAWDAVCAALWLHARAAEIAGAGLNADDLLPAIRVALVECSA